MFYESHAYFSWIILRMRIITSGGLSAVFHGLLPPSLLELQLSVLQWSSVAPQGDIHSACCCSWALLNGGSRVAQPPSKSSISAPVSKTTDIYRGGSGYWLFALDQHSACTWKLFGPTCDCLIIFHWSSPQTHCPSMEADSGCCKKNKQL